MKLMTQLTLLGLLGTLLSIPVWASGGHGHGHGDHDEAEHGHHEGRTQISERFARESGVRTETVGPHTLQLSERLYGRIQPNAERVANVRAPYPGEIAEMRVSVGDRVEKGDVLAQIRSRDSLETYALRAPLSGVVTERLHNPGEFTGSEPLLVVQDLSEVWVELLAYPEQSDGLAVGQTVRVKASDSGTEGTVTIDYIAPHRLPGNQGTRLRASLNNEDGFWAPGQRITGEVLVEERQVPLAVRRSALQSFRGFTVVFARVDNTYEVRKLELGEQDENYVEVLGGIEAGTEYVTENSYLIKADILKSGASHAH